MLTFLAWLGCFCVLARAAVRRRELTRRHLVAMIAGGVALGGIAVLVGPSGLVLQKVIARLAMPAAWAWNLAWLAVIWGVARARRRVAIAGAAIGVMLTITGSEAVGLAMNHWLERDYRGDPYAQGTFDAVFVLGGGVDRAPHAHHELGSSGDRVMLAARMYKRGLTRILVTSGSAIEGLDETFDIKAATNTIFRDLGIPDEAVIGQPGNTRNTREEAAAAATLVRERGWKRVGLITSAWHMRRALALFEDAGVHAVPLAADHRGALRWDGLYSVIPRDAGYYMVSKACWEILGAAVGF